MLDSSERQFSKLPDLCAALSLSNQSLLFRVAAAEDWEKRGVRFTSRVILQHFNRTVKPISRQNRLRTGSVRFPTPTGDQTTRESDLESRSSEISWSASFTMSALLLRKGKRLIGEISTPVALLPRTLTTLITPRPLQLRNNNIIKEDYSLWRRSYPWDLMQYRRYKVFGSDVSCCTTFDFCSCFLLKMSNFFYLVWEKKTLCSLELEMSSREKVAFVWLFILMHSYTRMLTWCIRVLILFLFLFSVCIRAHISGDLSIPPSLLVLISRRSLYQ